MKRMFIAISTLVLIVAICAWSLWQVATLKKDMLIQIESLTAAVESGDQNEAVRLSFDLLTYWDTKEQRLMHTLRHAQIDSITLSIVRINALVSHDEPGETMAELSSITRQLEHLWKSEIPTYKNIF